MSMNAKEALEYCHAKGLQIKEPALRGAVASGKLIATNSNPASPRRGYLIFTKEALDYWIDHAQHQAGRPFGSKGKLKSGATVEHKS